MNLRKMVNSWIVLPTIMCIIQKFFTYLKQSYRGGGGFSVSHVLPAFPGIKFAWMGKNISAITIVKCLPK